ncbi:MAG: rRNA maturation RNase YbeY [Proteobacteria bacterium]|nr:rRNA maturation RNase YbeY [Pseudomonadota bacterium]
MIPPSPIKTEVIVQIDDPSWLQWKQEDEWSSFFEEISNSVFSHFQIECPLEISVLLTKDDYIKKLNAQYLEKDKPTNVLSFPQISYIELQNISDFGVPILLGDIVMSFETIRKESEEQKKLLMNHIIHLYLHSLLHLLGYDHIEDEDAQKMESLERHFLQNLGISNPYH